MGSKKGDRSFRVLRKRNTLHLAQERGEMLKPQKMSSKKFKAESTRNPRSWMNEDWGEDETECF
jgi:hypothetical protein